MRNRLTGFKLPKAMTFAEYLPRTPSGKVLKRALPEPYWEGVGRRIGGPGVIDTTSWRFWPAGC